MSEDNDNEPTRLTRVWWFFWAGWNRAACVTRGHDTNPNGFCARCGLPTGPFDPEGADHAE